MKILMVCLGNICRSPMAEGIMQGKIDAHDLDWEVDSAGTSSWHVGDRPDRRATECARGHDVDISKQNSRPFRSVDFDEFDVIFTMDQSNYNNVLSLAQNEDERNKVRMIMNEAQPGNNESVPDPYWDDNGFEIVFSMLDEACEAFINDKTNG